MNDLISKTTLLKHLDMAIDCKDCPRNADRTTYYDRCACSEVADICNIITDFATFADVQPIHHGHWIEVTPKHSQCSCCEVTCLIAVYPISAHANFCPNCGAKMDDDKPIKG